ncbi:biorientation of chromosomes in cell division protein 1-like 1 [Monomorium pharaonis]|uniref:biorientation of chromosomes in cell division protein 1-like 1 n=1 Tax=Monomorium pharaonis TaxID=307658 RepID=UPI00063F0ACE|nr:biorientation of chromosomes in cell division protein 1-like 1 [Monomorium pharaonis]
MSSDPIKNRCPITCPYVRKQLRIAIKESPNITEGIFPRKKDDVEPRLPLDVISEDMRDERTVETALAEELEDVEVKSKVFEKVPSILEPIITTPRKIADDIKEKIYFIEEKKLIEVVPSREKIDSRDEEKIDFEKEELIQEPAPVQKEAPIEKIVNHVEEKIDSITEEEIDRKPVIVQEEIVIPTQISEHVDEEIKDKDLDVKEIVEKPVEEALIEEPEIIEDEIEQAPITEIELEPSRELEKHFELEEREEEKSIPDVQTDYEQFIDEELQEALPAVIAKEIPEEPRAVRREISRNAATLYEKIDPKRPVGPPSKREAVTAMPEERPVREEVSARRALEDSTITERIVSRKLGEDVCEETCSLVKEQEERIMRKLKARQRLVDHYYLTKGFSYFEDVCTCSLACMVYTLSRDPFVKSIFASLAVFAIGLKLCSELDAWEMPSRIS